jgi:hypothetical protein
MRFTIFFLAKDSRQDAQVMNHLAAEHQRPVSLVDRVASLLSCANCKQGEPALIFLDCSDHMPFLYVVQLADLI